MKNIFLWFRIIRPQTLFASLCPVLIGLLVSPAPINTSIAVLTIVCALSLQILSNLINDYYDYLRGTDKKGRKGYKRALVEGEVTLRQMLVAILVALLVSIITGAWLVIYGGLPILLIGISAIFFAWLYTATPYSLSYLGIGDVFVYLYYGIVATMGTTFLQGAPLLYLPAFYAGSVCGLISMCVLIINNLRDIYSDKSAGKRTFPVRFGRKAGEIGMLLVILLTPLFAYLAFGVNYALLIVIPLLIVWGVVVRTNSGKVYNICLLCIGLCNVLYTLLAWLSILTKTALL
ncbi:MAG: 1,4-dihydroxy-2-naphthoate octaprenyltransferase [Paludibacteraceae bacterium]